MTDPIRDLQLELERERKRSHDLDACLADMGRVNGRLRESLRVTTDALAGMVDSHLDHCRDDRDEVCSACVMALLALEDRSPQGVRNVLGAPPPSPASQEPTP